MKQTKNNQPCSILQNKCQNILNPKKPFQHHTQRTTITPTSKLNNNEQIEVNQQKRSISFFQESSIQHKENRVLRVNSKKEEKENSSDNSSDSFNIWNKELEEDRIFELYFQRFIDPYYQSNGQSFQGNINMGRLMKGFKSITGQNLLIQNIGKIPYYHNVTIKERQIKNIKMANNRGVLETRPPFNALNSHRFNQNKFDRIKK